MEMRDHCDQLWPMIEWYARMHRSCTLFNGFIRATTLLPYVSSSTCARRRFIEMLFSLFFTLKWKFDIFSNLEFSQSIYLNHDDRRWLKYRTEFEMRSLWICTQNTPLVLPLCLLRLEVLINIRSNPRTFTTLQKRLGPFLNYCQLPSIINCIASHFN